jgi:anti-sigma B factor antagonist
MSPAADGVVGLGLSSRTERGYVLAALRGELDTAAAPTLREQLLGLLGPAASRLIIDLSAINYADARGLAVLVGTGRRAGLLGGFLRLAAPSPEVAKVLSATGLSRHLDIFPTIHAAITGPPRSQHRPDRQSGRQSGHRHPRRRALSPHVRTPGHARHAADGGELGMAVAAVLTHPDAWRDTDPRRRFAPALHANYRMDHGSPRTMRL